MWGHCPLAPVHWHQALVPPSGPHRQHPLAVAALLPQGAPGLLAPPPAPPGERCAWLGPAQVQAQPSLASACGTVGATWGMFVLATCLWALRRPHQAPIQRLQLQRGWLWWSIKRRPRSLLASSNHGVVLQICVPLTQLPIGRHSWCKIDSRSKGRTHSGDETSTETFVTTQDRYHGIAVQWSSRRGLMHLLPLFSSQLWCFSPHSRCNTPLFIFVCLIDQSTIRRLLVTQCSQSKTYAIYSILEESLTYQCFCVSINMPVEGLQYTSR